MCVFYTELFIICLFGLSLSFLWWFLLVRYILYLYLYNVFLCFLSFGASYLLSSVLESIRSAFRTWWDFFIELPSIAVYFCVGESDRIVMRYQVWWTVGRFWFPLLQFSEFDLVYSNAVSSLVFVAILGYQLHSPS